MKKKCQNCDAENYTGKHGLPKNGWRLILGGSKKPRRKYYCPKCAPI